MSAQRPIEYLIKIIIITIIIILYYEKQLCAFFLPLYQFIYIF